MSYEGIDETNEYIDLSGRNFKITGVLGILNDLQDDTMLRHVNLSYNLNADEMAKPSNIHKLFEAMKTHLAKNKCLTALDLAGNHLFQNSPHPANEHLTNYIIDFTDILNTLHLTHIDISDNGVVGTGRKNKGLAYLVKNFIAKRGVAFSCRTNKLHSPSFLVISTCLGTTSKLIYLDLSDNMGGLDPNDNPNSEGIHALCAMIAQTPRLHTLKLAKNCLRDRDIVMLSEAMYNMPQLRHLDIAGNDCHCIGCDALHAAIMSHCALKGHRDGIRSLDLSSNPIGGRGIAFINHALVRSETLMSLKVSHCSMDDDAMRSFQTALSKNPHIVVLEVEGNPVSSNTEIKTLAEAAANRLIKELHHDQLSLNASLLTITEYKSLAKKLRFLPSKVLAGLHYNPSFNQNLSEMKEALHLLEAPGRKADFKVITNKKKEHTTIHDRLKHSALVEKKMELGRKIYGVVIKWFREVQYKNNIKRMLAEAKAKKDAENRHNDDDDEFKY